MDYHQFYPFDILVPSLSIGLEYQGEHHFLSVSYTSVPVEIYKLRDQEKLKVLQKLGITLITVPYWWDKNLER